MPLLSLLMLCILVLFQIFLRPDRFWDFQMILIPIILVFLILTQIILLLLFFFRWFLFLFRTFIIRSIIIIIYYVWLNDWMAFFLASSIYVCQHWWNYFQAGTSWRNNYNRTWDFRHSFQNSLGLQSIPYWQCVRINCTIIKTKFSNYNKFNRANKTVYYIKKHI